MQDLQITTYFLFYFSGNEAGRATKNSISSAFSSLFRTKKTSPVTNPNSPINNQSAPTNHTNMSSSKSSISLNEDSLSRFEPEIRGYAIAAVILEEWLQELAAIAQEQSVLMKEIAFHLGMAIDDSNSNAIVTKKNSNSNTSSAMIENPVVIRTNNIETSMS